MSLKRSSYRSRAQHKHKNDMLYECILITILKVNVKVRVYHVYSLISSLTTYRLTLHFTPGHWTRQKQGLFLDQISSFMDNHAKNKETCCERIYLYLSDEHIRLHLGDVVVQVLSTPKYCHYCKVSVLKEKCNEL